jgi:hypothetical protein
VDDFPHHVAFTLLHQGFLIVSYVCKELEETDLIKEILLSKTTTYP